MTEPVLARVLVVEDNGLMRAVALAHLNRLAHVEIDVAEDGQAAVMAVRNRTYALILMDIHMPRMDGLEATATIRSLEQELGRPPSTIVAVTASDTRDHCLAAGMDDYILKPADFDRIIRTWLPDARRAV
jgi:CheY-like chemotaxis protein